MIVLDGSGSMWGGLGESGQSKLRFLQTELPAVLSATAPAAEVGLTTFGARSSASCGAAEVVVELGGDKVTAVEGALQRFNPQGRGPIVHGLTTAIQSLANDKRPVRLLLIHDGPDNCRQDVCAFAGSVREEHPNVAVDILTLALGSAVGSGMSCLADATGGRLVSATNVEDARRGLTELLAALARPAGAVPRPRAAARPVAGLNAAQPVTPPPGISGIALGAHLAASKVAISQGLTWQIQSETGESALSPGIVDQPGAVDLPPGRYRVVMRSPTIRKEQVVEVKEGARTPVTFAIEGGLLDLARQLGQRDSPFYDAVVAVSELAAPGRAALSPVWTGLARDAASLVLAEGLYQLDVTTGFAHQSHAIEIKAGSVVRPALAAVAKLIVDVKGLSAKQLAAARITVARDATDLATSDDKQAVTVRSTAAKATFQLPSGTYRVALDAFGSQATGIVVLPPGQTVRHEIGLSQMALRVATKIAGAGQTANAGVRYRVWRAAQPSLVIASSRRPEPTFHLTAGKYRIESRIGQQNAVIVREFDIEGAGRGTLELRHEAGEISFTISGDSTVHDGTYWEVTDAAGRMVWRSFETAPKLVLAPGAYHASAAYKLERWSAKFIVVSGHQQTVNLTRQ